MCAVLASVIARPEFLSRRHVVLFSTWKLVQHEGAFEMGPLAQQASVRAPLSDHHCDATLPAVKPLLTATKIKDGTEALAVAASEEWKSE